MKNKETDKQCVAVFFFVTQYNSSLSSFLPNFRILTQVVAEKSLTEKKITDRQTDRQTNKQTNIITEKAKTIYPLYTSYRGYKKKVYRQTNRQTDKQKNVHMYYKSERRKNEKLKKGGKMRICILISIYTVHFAYLKVYRKFENTGSNRS